MPTFAAEDGFVLLGLRPFLERCPSREAAFLSPCDPAVVCRRVVVAPRVLLAESFDRLGVRVVALRVVPPEPVSLAAADLLREPSEFVVLALGRRGLLLGRAWASAPLVWSARVDGAFLGLRALRRSDVVPGFVALLDRARLGLPPESSAVAGAVLPRLEVLAARLFAARRPASGFLCVDARVPCGRSTSASTCRSLAELPRSGCDRWLRARVEWLRVAVRVPLAGTSVISTSPNSDTGRSGTRRPSSSAASSPSSAS